ncbi:CpaE family protein [Radiobacillus sp. PE A8.2]|uniref:AAA family ATPase n=1 Tax=Radiobacillus sp. PE A8.2 TaxID=3380349 RepID=UPI00388E5C2E
MARDDTTELEQKGKVIAVCSAKGGVGRTLISVNLSVALTKKNLNVCLLDGDFQFGDISLAMDLQPTFTIKDVVEEIEGMDDYSLNNFLSTHSSGVNVLAAPDRPEFAELITNEALVRVIEMLRNQFDFVIIDTGTEINGHAVDIIEQADQILAITTLEMTSLKNTRLLLETYEKLGIREKVQLVINRFDMESLIKAEEVPGMFNEVTAIQIPNNFKITSQSLNLGIPFTISQTKSNLSKVLFKMAENMTSNTAHTKKDKSSKNKKWFGKKRKE